MQKPIIAFSLLLLLVGSWSSTSAQTPPEVEVVMSTDSAGQNDIITADVVVHSDDVIVGADIGITVDECLRVEGRENGGYLPTVAEESGFVPFEELTQSSTRLAATVLGQEVVADPTQYFFRVSLRVLCDTGQADVTVNFAQLVNKDLETYKLEDDQITITDGTVTMGPGQPVVATAQVFPTPTEFEIPTAEPSATTESAASQDAEETEDEGLNLVLVIIIVGLVGLVVALLVVILSQRRRSQGK